MCAKEETLENKLSVMKANNDYLSNELSESRQYAIDLHAENEHLKKENAELKKNFEPYVRIVDSYGKANKILNQKIKELELELAMLKTPKTEPIDKIALLEKRITDLETKTAYMPLDKELLNKANNDKEYFKMSKQEIIELLELAEWNLLKDIPKNVEYFNIQQGWQQNQENVLEILNDISLEFNNKYRIKL